MAPKSIGKKMFLIRFSICSIAFCEEAYAGPSRKTISDWNSLSHSS